MSIPTFPSKPSRLLPTEFAPQSLQEKHCIITGASRGMGKAIALRLAEAGAFLHLLGRNPLSLEAVQEEVLKHSPIAEIYPTDLSKESEIQAFLNRFTEAYSTLDLLIHNAGKMHLGSVQSSSLQDWDSTLAVNLRAPYALIHGLLPRFNPKFAQILMVNSTVQAGANLSAYAASKHALQTFTDSLRAEVNEKHIRVMSIYPGSTATNMIREVYAFKGKTEFNPGRLLQPEDIAHTVHHMLTAPTTAEITDLKIRPFFKN